MRRATFAAASTVALLLAGQARAVTGNQLNDACQGADTGFCMGYVLGAYEASALLGVGICIPAGVSNNQLRDVVKTVPAR
jgi:Rap1a immunity proteins